MVVAKPKKSSPTWNDVKGKVADFDRAGLVGVLQALYAASNDNRAFVHARLGLGADVYFDALMRMFEQALKLSVTLPVDQRDVLLDRLEDVRHISHDFGYGLGDGMDMLFTSYGSGD